MGGGRFDSATCTRKRIVALRNFGIQREKERKRDLGSV